MSQIRREKVLSGFFNNLQDENFIAFIPMGLNLLTSYYLQSILSVKRSLFISLLRNVILSSVAILTFPLIFGVNSLWLVMPVVECLVLVLSVVFLRRQQ